MEFEFCLRTVYLVLFVNLMVVVEERRLIEERQRAVYIPSSLSEALAGTLDSGTALA